MPGLFARLGAFGQKVIRDVISTGKSLAQTVGMFREPPPAVELAPSIRDYGRVRVEEQYRPFVERAEPDRPIPHSLYVETDIPFTRPYAYKVAVYGRDLATGRFAHQEYDLPASRELSPNEIEQMMSTRLGVSGTSPQMQVFSVSTIAAYTREGEYPF